MGASVAYHLAARGRRDVVVLDRADGPGAGSTGRATGGFRAQYATADQRPALAARAGEAAPLRRGDRRRSGLRPAGYLWLASSAAELDGAARGPGGAARGGAGRGGRRSTPEDIARLNPAVRLDGIVGGAFCPSDGFIRPLRILEGLPRGRGAARRAGRVGRRGDRPRRDGGGRIVGGRDRRAGRSAADAVVNAAGAWAAPVAAWRASTLPVTPLRRQVAATAPCDLLPADMPMTIWAGDGFHLRVRDGRVLLLWPTPGVRADPFDASVDPAWVDAVVAMAHARVPVLRGRRVDRAALLGAGSTRCRRTSTPSWARRRSAPTSSSSTAPRGTA